MRKPCTWIWILNFDLELKKKKMKIYKLKEQKLIWGYL